MRRVRAHGATLAAALDGRAARERRLCGAHTVLQRRAGGARRPSGERASTAAPKRSARSRRRSSDQRRPRAAPESGGRPRCRGAVPSREVAFRVCVCVSLPDMTRARVRAKRVARYSPGLAPDAEGDAFLDRRRLHLHVRADAGEAQGVRSGDPRHGDSKSPIARGTTSRSR